MIQMRTILQVADNSGARKISCILPLGGSTGRYASLGDIITANVKESAPGARTAPTSASTRTPPCSSRKTESPWAPASSAPWPASCATRSS